MNDSKDENEVSYNGKEKSSTYENKSGKFD